MTKYQLFIIKTMIETKLISYKEIIEYVDRIISVQESISDWMADLSLCSCNSDMIDVINRSLDSGIEFFMMRPENINGIIITCALISEERKNITKSELENFIFDIVYWDDNFKFKLHPESFEKDLSNEFNIQINKEEIYEMLKILNFAQQGVAPEPVKHQ